MNASDNEQYQFDSTLPTKTSLTTEGQQPTATTCDLYDDCHNVNASDNEQYQFDSTLPTKTRPATEGQQPTATGCDLNNDCHTLNACIWIEDLGLKYADKQVNEDGSTITAAIINASSTRIKQENNALAGLLPIVPTGSYRGNGELVIQILRVKMIIG